MKRVPGIFRLVEHGVVHHALLELCDAEEHLLAQG
jgi:hypothetical protein